MLIEIIKKRITFLWLIIFIGFIIGINSFLTIPKENSPATDIPMFIVNVVSYGQSPEIIEKNIVNNLEDEIKSISGIKKIESVSNYNFGTVIATFNDDKNVQKATQELNDAVDEVSYLFPANTLSPTIKQVSPDDTPIYSFGVSAEAFTSDIYNTAEKLEDSLKGIEGISETVVVGKPTKKISVYLDYDKMNKFNINISQVAGVLGTSFVNSPVDKKDVSGNLYSYEMTTYPADIDKLLNQLKNTDIVNSNSQSIKLRDIANIYYKETSESEKSFINDKGNILNTVSFDVKATPGSDKEKIVKAVKEKIESWKMQNPKYQVFETYSVLVDINSVYGTFVSNFWQTGLIILIILFLFIGVRISLGVTIAFPLVYFITFILLRFAGYTFNSIVSFALVLTLGIMVDNLIVITEGIVEQFKLNKGITYWQAAKKAVEKHMWSIIPGTLITVFMFLPLAFMLTGVIGQFIKPLPITIGFTLITSLVVSLILLPVILAKILPENVGGSSGILTKPLDKVGGFFSKISKKLTINKFTAFLTILSFWGALFFSFFLIGSGAIKSDFMPQTDRDNIFINVKYPSGYSLEKNGKATNKILNDINSYLNKKYDVDNLIQYEYINLGNIYSTSGVGNAQNVTANYQSYINIKLIPGDNRELLSYKISEDLSNYINTYIKKKYTYLKDISVLGGMSMSGGKEVGFYLIGDDIKEIAKYLEKIEPEVEKINGVYNVSTNYEFTNGKINYHIDANKLKRSGMSLNSLIQLYTSLENSSYTPNGLQVYNFTNLGDDAIPLLLFTKYKGNIDNVKVGDTFVESVLDKRDLEPELKNIAHIDGQIQLTIEADKNADIPLGTITGKIDEIIKDNPLPEGLSFRYNAGIEDSSGASADLGTGLLTGIMLMFFILVLKYNSIKYGVIILTSTILSFIGVILALLFAGFPLSFPAQLGLFGVIGVGVNNAILFIDGFHGKAKGDLKEKLLSTVQSRFTPIFLTSSTTIAGLITLAIKDELWGALAISFIGGLLLNVFMILVYLPALLYLTEKKEK